MGFKSSKASPPPNPLSFLRLCLQMPIDFGTCLDLCLISLTPYTIPTSPSCQTFKDCACRLLLLSPSSFPLPPLLLSFHMLRILIPPFTPAYGSDSSTNNGCNRDAHRVAGARERRRYGFEFPGSGGMRHDLVCLPTTPTFSRRFTPKPLEACGPSFSSH